MTDTAAPPLHENVTRRTVRFVRLPDHGLALDRFTYGSRHALPTFQPNAMEEVVLDGDGGPTYTVHVSGPLLTKTGKPHATACDGRTWHVKDLDGFPPESEPYRWGPDRLSAWTAPAPEDDTDA